MKLKKILSGFLAAAVAAASMVTASVTAGAAAVDLPEGTEEVLGTFTLTVGDVAKDEVTVTQYGGCWASLYGLSDDTFTNENNYVKVTYTTDDVVRYGDNNDPLSTFLGWGWSAYSGWLNVGKFYDGTVTAGKDGQNLKPAANSTDTVYYCYLPVSDFTAGDNISGNVQSYIAGNATIKSVQLVQISSVVIPAPELPENEYVFDTASGTADNWSPMAQTEVGNGETITSAVLEGDFVVVVPYQSESRPKLVLSDGSGDGEALNWVQISPYVVVDGVAYYTKADVAAAWKAAGGSETLADVVRLFITCSDAKEVTVTGVKLYSSVAVPTYSISVDTAIENGEVTPDKTEAKAGDTITLTVKPATGYEFDAFTVATSTAGEDTVTVGADNTFIMPAANVTVTATFKLKEVPLTAITLDETAVVLVGDTLELTAAKVPSTTTDKTEITWESSDETVATVSAAGVVTGKKAGTATITATCGDFSAECKVTVTMEAKPCTDVTLDKTTAEVMMGETVTLKATKTPLDTTDKITWESSDSAVVTVKDGVVTGVAEGTATITVKCGDKTATCEVTVKSAACTGVTLDKTTAELKKGETVTLKATVVPADTIDTITWESSAPAVATVKDGVVTGVARGTATITVKCGNQTATCAVSVSEDKTVAAPVVVGGQKTYEVVSTVNGKEVKTVDTVYAITEADLACKGYEVTITNPANGKTITREITNAYKSVTVPSEEKLGNDTFTGYYLVIRVTNVPKDVNLSYAFNKIS